VAGHDPFVVIDLTSGATPKTYASTVETIAQLLVELPFE